MPPAIVLRRLSKSFAQREVLRDVTLEVERGTIVGLLGPNGAGKTTLLEILSTLLLPTSGEAFVEGLDVVREAAAVKRLVGYCPCGFDSFYPRLTATANLEFFAALNGLARLDGRRQVQTVCDLIGINGSRHLDFQRHSSGMKQKLGLARALIINPPLLLLDEPTKSLDLQAQAEIWRLLRGTFVDTLRKTVVLVTHNLTEAQEVCDRVAILHQGRIVEVAAPSSVTPHRLTKIFGASELQTVSKPAMSG